MYLKGTARIDSRTKRLVSRLRPGDIAIIDHQDIDEVAGKMLLERKIKAVINMASSISGKYPNLGPKILLDNGIPIFDETDKDLIAKVTEGDILEIRDNSLYCNKGFILKLRTLTKEQLNNRLETAHRNLKKELDRFIENTLEYAHKEKEIILDNVELPEIKTQLYNKHVLVVIRGKNYKEDLKAIKAYLEEVKPVMIGVDGGADALIEAGYTPDIILGDMDSVSDMALKKCKEIIVHAYKDGRAPGLKRIKSLNLDCSIFPFPGTSEDIALLLAYEKKADLIVAVGSHSNLIDFLEKGRKGMASTFLVRLKVGSKLVDAKGVNKLYNTPLKARYLLALVCSAFFPIAMIIFTSPQLQQLYRLIQLHLKIMFGI